MKDHWQDYFLEQLSKFNFVPWTFDGEDKNLQAFSSRELFGNWFSQPPGAVGEPYRDEGFYTRELTRVSLLVKPDIIVEFGTSLGIGTILLSILNPQSQIITVDNRLTQYLPGDIEVPTGFLAKHMNIPIEYVHSDSSNFVFDEVDLCFIDGDHSYEGVCRDTRRAWSNLNEDKGAIIWHDYNDRHPGVIRAVKEFSFLYKQHIIELPDSSTVWTSWGT